MNPVDRGEAAGRAARELLDPAYEKEALIDLIHRRVSQFLGDLVDAVGGGGSTGGIIAAALIVLILIGVMTLITWRLRRTSRRRPPGVSGLFGGRTMNAADHRREAERLAAESAWTEAVQERLRAIARDLEERAIVDGMPGRTAHELATEASWSLPGFAGELATAARSFDDVTYGGIMGTREAYERMASLDDRLRQARPAPLATAGAALGGPADGGPAGGGLAGGGLAGGGPTGGPGGGSMGGPTACGTEGAAG